MAFKDFKHKTSVKIVYTGEGKGKTSAGIGLVCRALGSGWKVAFIQFIKYWDVGEDAFFKQIKNVFPDQFTHYKGGLGFYKAGEITAKGVSEAEHKKEALKTFKIASGMVSSGDYNLVVCDEINNAVHDGLLSVEELRNLLRNSHKNTSVCLTGRDFPKSLLTEVDIATSMTKLKHHFDDKFIANKGIDY